MHNNDEADRLAKESVDPKVRIDTHITHGETAHEGMAVPSHKEEITPEGPACVPHHPMCKWKQAANLTAAITNKAPPRHTTGYANKDGVYAKLWGKENPKLHKHSSHRYWNVPSATWSQRINSLQLRCGKFWTKQMACRHDTKCKIYKQ